MIDKSGQWWKGQGFDDLVDYLAEYTSRNYPAGHTVQSVCGRCRSATFGLVVDDEAGCAKRQCGGCGDEAFIGDSGEFWDDADPGAAACPCAGERFEVGVAFSLRDDGSVCWITVGARCIACGVLGVYADWKIDYDPDRSPADRRLMIWPLARRLAVGAAQRCCRPTLAVIRRLRRRLPTGARGWPGARGAHQL